MGSNGQFPVFRELPAKLPMSASKGMSESFRVAAFNTQNASRANQYRADHSLGGGHVAKKQPAEQPGEDDNRIVERRELHCAGVTVRLNNKILSQCKKHADTN